MALTAPSAVLTGSTIASSFDQLLFVDAAAGMTEATLKIVSTEVGKSALSISDEHVLIKGVDTNNAAGFEVQQTDGTSILKVAAGTPSVLVSGSGTKLYLSDAGGEYISGNGSHLTLTSGGDIILAVGATGSVYPSGDGGSQNTYYGHDAGTALISGGNYNTLFGYGTGAAITEGDFNVAIGGYVTMDSLVDGARNIAIGAGAMTAADGSESDNMAIGTDAMGTLNDNSSTRNIAIGNYAADGMGTVGAHIDNLFIGHNTGGGSWATAVSSYNVGIGNYSLGAAMNGALYNTACGYNSGGNVTEGDSNTLIGASAGANITTGINNVLIGSTAGDGFDAESDIIGIGYGAAGGAIDGANRSIAIGSLALDAAITQGGTVAIGYEALTSLTSGSENVAIGYQAATSLESADKCTAVGHLALDAAAGALNDANTAIGYNALGAAQISSGGNVGRNTALGTQSGDSLVAGYHNIMIGYNAQIGDVAGSNQIAIGYNVVGVDTDNSVTLGNADVTDVYCASDAAATVHVAAVHFPGTQVADADANNLDDYEEGTWTPTWTNGTASNATYVKIGRLVYASGQFTNSSGSDTSGSMAGLPYTSAIDGSDGGGSGYNDVGTVTWSVLKVSGDGFRFYTGSTQQQIGNGEAARFFLTYQTAT